MKPIPMIRKELDRNGVIGFFSITKEKLSNFFNRTFIDNDLQSNGGGGGGGVNGGSGKRTTKNSRRASCNLDTPINGKVVKTKKKIKKLKLNGKISTSELSSTSDSMLNGSTNNNSLNGNENPPASQPKSPKKSSTSSENPSSPILNGEHTETDNNKVKKRRKKKTPSTTTTTTKTTGTFNEEKHVRICATKCNVTNFDDLNELQLELERRLSIIEKKKQTLEFESTRIEQSTNETDISNFLISKPKASFAKLRSIVLNGNPDWDAQLAPQPRIKVSKKSVHNAIEAVHNAFSPLTSLTLSSRAAANYLSKVLTTTELDQETNERLEKITKQFNRLPFTPSAPLNLFRIQLTESQQEFVDFVKKFTDSKFEETLAAKSVLNDSSLFGVNDQTSQYRALVPNFFSPKGDEELSTLLQELNIIIPSAKTQTAPVSPPPSVASAATQSSNCKSSRSRSQSPNKNIHRASVAATLKEEKHEDELCREKNGHNSSSSILRQLLSTPPKVSPTPVNVNGCSTAHSSISQASPSSVQQQQQQQKLPPPSSSSPNGINSPANLSLSYAQLDDLLQKTRTVLLKMRDFEQEFAPMVVARRFTQNEEQFSNICADIDSTAKMCSFMNGNLPIFTSNCLGCQPARPPSLHSSLSPPSLSPLPPHSLSVTMHDAMVGSATSVASSSIASTSQISDIIPATASTITNNSSSTDSHSTRLMKHCGVLCGALTPETNELLSGGVNELTLEQIRAKRWQKYRRRPFGTSPRKGRPRKSPKKQQIIVDEEENDDVQRMEEETLRERFDSTFDDLENDFLLQSNSDIDLTQLDQNFDFDGFVSGFKIERDLIEDGINDGIEDCQEYTSNLLPFMESKPTPQLSCKRKLFTQNSTPALIDTSIDSVISRLVETELVPLIEKNRHQIDVLHTGLDAEIERQQKHKSLLHEYVTLLESVHRYIMKNRGILKKDADLVLKNVDKFLDSTEELQSLEQWINPSDLGEDPFQDYGLEMLGVSLAQTTQIDEEKEEKHESICEEIGEVNEKKLTESSNEVVNQDSVQEAEKESVQKVTIVENEVNEDASKKQDETNQLVQPHQPCQNGSNT